MIRVFLLVTLCFASANALGNPNTDKPDAPFPAHGTIPEASKMASSLYGQYAKLSADINAIHKAGTSGPPEKIPHRLIESIAASIFQGKRDARHLQMMGEFCAMDLIRKYGILDENLHLFGQKFGRTQPGMVQRTKNIQRMTKDLPKWQKRHENVMKLLSSGKIEQATSEAEKMGGERYAMYAIMSDISESKTWWEVGFVEQTLGPCDAQVNPLRTNQYQQAAAKRLAEHLEPVNSFEQDSLKILSQLNSGGKVDFGDGTNGGPVEAFQWQGAKWSSANTSVLRALGVAYAFQIQIPDQSMEQLNASGKKSLASIIEAAGQSASDTEATVLYGRLLREIAILNRRVSNNELNAACQPALDKFLSTHAALAANVKRYDRATKEVLKMRRQLAEQRARSFQSNFQNTASLIATDHSGPPAIHVAPKTLTNFAETIIKETASVILNKPVYCEPVIRLSPTSTTALSPLKNFHYVNLVPLAIEAERTALADSLIASSEYPPLTLEAADALTSSEYLDYRRAGGTLGRIHLESMTTRLITLPDVAAAIGPLGQLPRFDQEVDPKQAIYWRFDIVPTWLQNNYFTVVAAAK